MPKVPMSEEKRSKANNSHSAKGNAYDRNGMKQSRPDNAGPKESHHGGNSTGSIREPMGNPDVGPAVREGEHHYNKGYVSNNEHFSPAAAYPDNQQRGNDYMNMQNSIVKKDSQKLYRSEFTKIA